MSRIALCAARCRPQRRPGGFVLVRPGRGPGASKPGRPLPGLARRSYRGPSAAAAASCSSRSASLSASARAAAAARGALGPGKRERSELRAAGARSRSSRGRPEPGRPFILLGVAAAASPELGETLGEGRQGGCWVTGDESRAPSRRMRTPPAPPGRAPSPRRPLPPAGGGLPAWGSCAPQRTPRGAL